MYEPDLRVRVLKHLYKIPFYKDLPRTKKNELYDAMMKVFAEEEFCEKHNVKKVFNEQGSSVEYCCEHITFADKYGAENFITDMHELSMCCSEKW